ncbi:uncharacterized protein LOC124458024 [Xenia sp. Carnegie-2017]|uniref:uncharacterized protein LOC124458024 n=1 Tax=Xenia sp. Carnegie-2017 TaxID=2897299 RepID=UPI001F040C93|nr:uncharacterized protein LOC124458024 [Xenia sp. Carnegie-2017]
MFTNSQKRRLNPAAKPTIFDIPNKPPTVGQKRRILRRTTTDIATKAKRQKLIRKSKATEVQESVCDSPDQELMETDDTTEKQGHQENLSRTRTLDFCCQTSTSLTNNTPRKKKQKMVIRSKQEKIRRLNTKLNKILKNKATHQQVLENALEKLPDHLANFVRTQIKLHTAKKKGRRYSPEMKSMAISLYHSSGKAYRLLSKLFILPSKTSLRNYISRVPTETGISQATVNTLQQKVSQMDPMERLCTLCMDEISLKCHLQYSIPKDKVLGLEDFGSGFRTNKVATTAMVLLTRSISGR